MSHGRSGKLQASLQQQHQQHQQPRPKPHVPPLHLQQAKPTLWREADAAVATDRPSTTSSARTARTTEAILAPQADPRTWTWDAILASAHQHGTSAKPYDGANAAPSVYRTQFERPITREGLDLGGALNAEADARVRRIAPKRDLPPTTQVTFDAVNAMEQGQHPSQQQQHPAYATTTHTRVHNTTTTTITQTQTQTTESITTSVPVKPRAVGDGGAMLSYGREDGPSVYTAAMLPALRTSEREELQQLSEALDFFVAKLDTSKMQHLRLDDRDAVERLMDLLNEEQAVYDLFFDEVIRQVSTQCRERGDLLTKIRGYYAGILRRVPLHLYAIQSELSAQQQLNHTLQEEQRVMREQTFAIKVELGAYTHRFKEAAHSNEMLRDMLSRAEHEKDRARSMFTQFREEWETQRKQLEEQLTLLKEQREDYLATASATAAALQKSKNLNGLVEGLLDESDSDEELINQRITNGQLVRQQQSRPRTKEEKQADEQERHLLDATIDQLKRDKAAAQAKRASAKEEQRLLQQLRFEQAAAAQSDDDTPAKPAKPSARLLPASAHSNTTASIAAQATDANSPVASDVPSSPASTDAATAVPQTAEERRESRRRERDQRVASAKSRIHSQATSRAASPLLSAHTQHHGLSALPDVYTDTSDALLPDQLKQSRPTTTVTSKSSTARASPAERLELKTMRHAFRTNAAMIEAWRSEAETLASWTKQPNTAREHLIDALQAELPRLDRDLIVAVVEHPDPTVSGALPVVLDFLHRIDSCSFNAAELMLLRAKVPPTWVTALRQELIRRGLGEVAATLFSSENERKAALAALLAQASSSDEEPDYMQANLTASSEDEMPPHAKSQRKSKGDPNDIATLNALANPSATRSAREATLRAAMEAGESIDPTSVTARATKLQKQHARDERRQKKKEAAAAAAAEQSTADEETTEPRRRASTKSAAASRSGKDASHTRRGSFVSAANSRRASSSTPIGRSASRTESASSRSSKHASSSAHTGSTTHQRTMSNGSSISPAIRARDLPTSPKASPSVAPLSGSNIDVPSPRLQPEAASVRMRADIAAASAGRTRAPLSREQEHHEPVEVVVSPGSSRRASVASVLRLHHAAPSSDSDDEDDQLAVEYVGGGETLHDRPSSGSDLDEEARTAAMAAAARKFRGRETESTDASPTTSTEATTTATGANAPSAPPTIGDLASRRQTLPADNSSTSLLEAASAAVQAQPPRPKSIAQVGHHATSAPRKPAAHPGAKAHHRHHSRADPSSSMVPTPRGAHAIRPFGGQPSQEAHPILTLSQEHAQAANDPRANDDHEVVFRQDNTTQQQQQQQQPPIVVTHPPKANSIASYESPAAVSIASSSTLHAKPASQVPPAHQLNLPRREAVDPTTPRSFFEASQVLPVSKILVASSPMASVLGGAKSHVKETARERELQLVVSDLIAQNELLHAQRQALAQLHGVKDTGAPALPAQLGNFASNSNEARALLQSSTVAAQQHEQQRATAAKQNALLAKVNEYLQAYRAARKAAANDPTAAPSLAAQADASDATAPSALHFPAAPNAASDPQAHAHAMARNVVAGQRNLLYHCRFLTMLKSAMNKASTSSAAKDEDAKEQQDGITPFRSTLTSRAPSSARSMPPPSDTGSDTRRHHLTQQFSLAWLVKWLRGVYDAKLARDDLCRAERAPLQRFPEFILEVQRKKYGLDALAARKTWDIIASLARHRDTDRECALFAEFLEESRALDELILFLRTRAVVLASTVGLRWPGHLLERGTKSCAEYISLCRARDVIASIFADAPSMQDEVYRAILPVAITWNQLPDPISAARWETLLPGRLTQVDERCVAMTDFLERILNQFRGIELQLRHQQWAEDLFNSSIAATGKQTGGNSSQALVANGGDVRMDFASFQQVFALAEPRYTSREIAQLYSNVTRNAGLKTLSKPLFKRLIHQLMNEGVMFPLLKHANYETATLVRMLLRHWTNFKPFVTHLQRQLEHSERAHDVAAANNLRAIRYALEKEIARAASGHAADAEDEAENGGALTVTNRASTHSSVTRRLVSLYRGLLNCISAHQSSFMLVSHETPLAILHTELKTLQHVILQRHRLHDTNEARVDAWLENLAALDTDERLADSEPQRQAEVLLPLIGTGQNHDE